MNKEYYKANQVVFGLRDEYVRIKKRLEILKKYTKLNSKYKDLNFTIVGDRIIYDFAYKHKNLFSLTHPNIIAEPLEKKEDGYYTGYTLQIINQDSFKIIADEMLQDKFSKSLPSKSCFNNGQDEINIDISYGTIWVYWKNILKEMTYYSDQDQIYFYKKRGLLTEQEMHDILETPIPSELLSDYYRNIIDNSTSSRKNVELVLNRKRRKAYNLEVINTEDRIILKEKVNKKNL